MVMIQWSQKADLVGEKKEIFKYCPQIIGEEIERGKLARSTYNLIQRNKEIRI